MSPATAAAPLPVHRYIGSCLISAHNPRHQRAVESQPQHRHQHYYQRRPACWPLVSVTPPPPPQAQPQPQGPRNNGGKHRGESTRSPLSRLAVHTQGAPLVAQTARHNNRGRYKPQPPPNLGGADKQRQEPKPKDPPSDPAASDEGSENTLPRIIKPRKRRKKDRKPQQPAHAHREASSEPPPPSRAASSPQALVETSAIVTLQPYTPLCYEAADAFRHEEKQPQQQQQQPEEAAPAEPEEEEPGSACQCRYCDPAGVIWDVERRCYSPFLTPPAAPYTHTHTHAHEPGGGGGLQVSSEIVTSPNGHRDIEIKFFSAASPPRPPAPAPAPVTPPWSTSPPPYLWHYRALEE